MLSIAMENMTIKITTILAGAVLSTSFGHAQRGGDGVGTPPPGISISVLTQEYYGESTMIYRHDGVIVRETTPQYGRPRATVSIAEGIEGESGSANCRFKVKYRVSYTGARPTNAYVKLSGEGFFGGSGSTASIGLPKVATRPGYLRGTSDLGTVDSYTGYKKLNFPQNSATPYVDIEVSGDGTAKASGAGASGISNLGSGADPLTKGITISRDPEQTFELGYVLDSPQRLPVVNEYENSKRYCTAYGISYVPYGINIPGSSPVGLWKSLLIGGLVGQWDLQTQMTWNPVGIGLLANNRLYEKQISYAALQGLRKNNSTHEYEAEVKGDDSWVPGIGGTDTAKAKFTIHPPSGLLYDAPTTAEVVTESEHISFSWSIQQNTWSFSTSFTSGQTLTYQYSITAGLSTDLSSFLHEFLKVGFKLDHNETWGDTKTKTSTISGTSGGPIPSYHKVTAWLETRTEEKRRFRIYDKYGADGYEYRFNENTMYDQTRSHEIKSTVEPL
jgi:hypothetical protein